MNSQNIVGISVLGVARLKVLSDLLGVINQKST
jgi:hypothetical protein